MTHGQVANRNAGFTSFFPRRIQPCSKTSYQRTQNVEVIFATLTRNSLWARQWHPPLRHRGVSTSPSACTPFLLWEHAPDSFPLAPTWKAPFSACCWVRTTEAMPRKGLLLCTFLMSWEKKLKWKRNPFSRKRGELITSFSTTELRWLEN